MIKITGLHKSYRIGKNSLHVLKGIDLKSANSILMIGVFLSAVLIIVVAATIWLRNKPDDIFEAVIEKEN